jgi:hypothetical protein
MTVVWDKIEQLARDFEYNFNNTGTKYSEENKNGWKNYLFTGPDYRRAHIEIVDFRESHNIYILHTTVFPHFNNPSPIYGFDAVCGPNKITGAFHDFSSAGAPDHFMMKWFEKETNKYQWNKPRDLPVWAKAIFSPRMIAAGNIREGLELADLCVFAHNSLEYYLKNVGKTQADFADYSMAQNRYCFYQKQNPQVVKSMVAMGIPEEEIRAFINETLFPEIPIPSFV